MATVGKNMLDSLTTGMYLDSKVIYREYIQNALDSINAAARKGILSKVKDGNVSVSINRQEREVRIEDNGQGISFCVYCYNVQPGIKINYANGENWLSN